tara:strand:- start:258 stop:638 length:381 start_codon:yes stop_codon:yes gene_type:complete
VIILAITGECGGIGRRTRLKICWPLFGRGGSSPPTPMMFSISKVWLFPLDLIASVSPVITVLTFLILGVFYLVIIPLMLFYWMNNRWNVMGKFERLFIYGLVFLFFPGLVIFAPFLNLRMNGKKES